ncbi:hypothetical protein HNO88_001318 [Novosphingobium chloroacetimidivorans]|uniref:Uncharacterized protein n=1 Tax=Novosphingobium chloroacetimidivorans TaxID=1428314 RepID=A0A7W7NW35_9SPHN|nr:hypothetical protein [Novosphingobium chloroacetimidivorans]MBB4858004.1 hypothetical protein [Novosphingobium chloroacetimidivorans]
MAASADTVLKLSLAAGALLAGAGVGYYFGVFLPAQAIHESVESGTREQTSAVDRTAQLERARRAEQQAREAARSRYQACVGAAQTSYSARWTAACRAQHQRQEAAYEDCADDLFSTREGCARKFPVEPEHGCALPLAISNRLVSDRDAARSQCLGEMQGGLAPDAWETPAG